MNQANRRSLTGGSLVLLAVLFVALTVMVSVLFRGMRIDLTDSQLYTISDGTQNILDSIDEPINLYFYFSSQASKEIPALKTYAIRVREVLEELAERSAGGIKLQVIDPLPFSEAEDQARADGLQGVPAGPGGDSVFFGLVGTNSVDGRETIGFFQVDKENFLEYDLAKMIYKLVNPKRAVIGLMSELPINRSFDPATRQMRDPWVIVQQIEQLFELKTVVPTSDSIDAEIDVLMLVHPKNLSEATLFAIDQFVLRGGKLLVFVDPHAEIEQPANPMDPQAAMFASRSSDLAKLFQVWGIAYDPNSVVLDATYGLQVSGVGGRPVRHIGILSLPKDAMDGDDVTMSQLNSMNVAQSGYIKQAAGAETRFVPLLTTTTSSSTVSVDRVKFLPDPANLLNDFVPTIDSYVIAARVQGQVKSAFPDGKPGASNAEGGEEGNDEGSEPVDALSESSEPVTIVVVADTDLLSDRLWVQVQNFFGQRLISAFANNGDFVINTLDNLTGSSDLISVRGRATSRRPFTRVEALEREAQEHYRATEQQLEQELQDAERKLNELQAGKEDGNLMIMSPEQQAELERFQQQRVEIRKKLRSVQRDLRSDIDRLGTHTKIVNMIAIPLLLTLFALAVAWNRSRRRWED